MAEDIVYHGTNKADLESRTTKEGTIMKDELWFTHDVQYAYYMAKKRAGEFSSHPIVLAIKRMALGEDIESTEDWKANKAYHVKPIMASDYQVVYT
jgi:hypothetical protein